MISVRVCRKHWREIPLRHCKIAAVHSDAPTFLLFLMSSLHETAPLASPHPTQQRVQDVNCQLRHRTASRARSIGSFHMSAASNFLVGDGHSQSKELRRREYKPGLPHDRQEYESEQGAPPSGIEPGRLVLQAGILATFLQQT